MKIAVTKISARDKLDFVESDFEPFLVRQVEVDTVFHCQDFSREYVRKVDVLP